jgi:hypothetical protein
MVKAKGIFRVGFLFWLNLKCMDCGMWIADCGLFSESYIRYSPTVNLNTT